MNFLKRSGRAWRPVASTAGDVHRFPGFRIVAASLLLAGCGSGGPPAAVIRSIELVNVPIGSSNVPEVPAGGSIGLRVRGDGVCRSLRINYGDGVQWHVFSYGPPDPYYDLASPATITSPTYAGLRGFMGVTAAGDGNECVGEVRARILVSPAQMTIGWGIDQNSSCSAAPFLTSLPRNVHFIVDIPPPAASAPLPAVGVVTADGHLYYDADGDAAAAGPTFPFPGLRKYSVVFETLGSDSTGVLRRSQIIQGGKHFTFQTVDMPYSHVRFCYNSDILPLHGPASQGFEVQFRMDSSNAVLPP